jgi:hypothetical protein
VKKIPISTSNAAFVTTMDACSVELAEGSFWRRFWIARRIVCLMPVELLVA